MRKIILGIDITVDGVIEAPETWRFGYLSPDLSVYDMSKVNSLDSLLLGRKTYEGFAASGQLRLMTSMESPAS